MQPDYDNRRVGMGRKTEKTGRQQLRLTVNTLKKKQSVRATFKLPEQVIELLSVIAGQMGIKQKTLFDQLVGDASVLGQVADAAQGYVSEAKKRRQKTFVLSRSSLLALNTIARQRDISRDLLVEISINRLLPIITAELEKHERRKVFQEDLKKQLLQGEELLARAERESGEDDQLYQMVLAQVELGRKNISLLEGMIQKGMPMEDW
jgi:hypothetical protein